jgi:hypothetical protein
VVVALVLATFPAFPLAAQDVGTGEVRLELERFGVGGAPRAGDWVGIRLRLLDTAPRQRDVLVRLSFPDPDGDQAVIQRSLTLNPGVWQSIWLYTRLPFSFGPNDIIPAGVHEAAEADPAEDVSGTGLRPARLLARSLLSLRGSQQVLDPHVGLIGVIGSSTMGLRLYSLREPSGGWSLLGHEATEVVPGLTPADLPDRWYGLAPFEALIWGAGDPAELRGERAAAVAEWVRRGGHLVVVFPPVGQTWTSRESNELYDLLPLVRITRHESVDLRPMASMFQKPPTGALPRALPASAVVHQFDPLPDASTAEAAPILRTPDGRTVVVRRLVGTGAVTLIGFDLSHRAFTQLDALDADVFWHRILGRRGELRSRDEITQLAGPPENWAIGSRQPLPLDRDLADEIAMTGSSAAGIFIGFVVFILYWLLAGPVGFVALRMMGWQRHSWVAYAAAAAAFTAISWGVATMLRPHTPVAVHVTFLDHVFGQPVQRARAWMSVLIPRYGTATLSVGEAEPPPGARGRLNAVSPWDPLRAGSVGSLTFPDQRPYVVDARAQHVIRVPARATVKQIQVDWSAGPVWSMPRPVAPPGNAGPPAVSFAAPTPQGQVINRLDGVLMHQLPGPLHDVVLIVVEGQRDFRPPPTGIVRLGADRPPLPANAFAYRLSNYAWAPDEPLDLALATQRRHQLEDISAEALLRTLVSAAGRPDQFGAPRADPRTFADRMLALALLPMLEPPDFRDRTMTQHPAVLRRVSHTMDLGRWFTQPCLILIGHLGSRAEPGPSPVPLHVDGQRVRTEGRTVVRWVYPLPPRPPGFAARDEPASPGE